MEKTEVFVMHSSHLDLYWIGAQADCLEKGAAIIDEALTRAQREPGFHFLLETARFLEYYAHAYPQRMDALKAAMQSGQFEMAASYTDRLENHVGGEALVRNALYGKKIIKDILGIDCRITCHPDLPGFAEQTPQIYKKSGIDYYLSARGFKNGARFKWQGLDDTDIIMYNIPGHYAYYDVERIIAGFEETKRHIGADFILLGCSAGDMGAAGTFIAKEDGKGVRYDIDDFLQKLNAKYPQYAFALANAHETLERMDKSNLKRMRGEYPSRWGHHGSAMNVYFYELDKLVDRKLGDAEKLTTICSALGMPQQLTMPKHPLKDPGGNGGSRRYYDLEITPCTVQEWIEYGWRLQIITQDHNFGGVEGAQSEFDRVIYKKAALKIADALIEMSTAALTQRIGCARNGVAIINTMNWTRDEIVALPDMQLDENSDYMAVDESGAGRPVVHSGGKWWTRAQGVPSVGIKTFNVQKGCAQAAQGAQIRDEDASLTVRNAHYEITVDKCTGCLVSLLDLETRSQWAGGGDVLDVFALEDRSLGGSERTADKPQLDRSACNTRSVRVSAANALFVELEIVTEVTDVKIIKTIRLPAHKKQVEVSVRFNWPGTPDVQLKMNLCTRADDSRIVYGVPYGAQKYGDYLETDSLKFGDDEISYELFNRYREVQGFFAVQQEGNYLMTATSQSAMDFLPGGAQVLLLRDVRNGAEQDYRFTNFGPRSYEFVFTSGKGEWEQAAKLPWERQQPMLAKQGDQAETNLTQESFLSTQQGVLTVLKTSEETENAIIARIYNPTGAPQTLDWQAMGKAVQPKGVNMDESPCAHEPTTLTGYEIKTVRF